jgi:hypothetical protein
MNRRRKVLHVAGQVHYIRVRARVSLNLKDRCDSRIPAPRMNIPAHEISLPTQHPYFAYSMKLGYSVFVVCRMASQASRQR